ncbi:hypothetical protein FKW77_000175 [Venturia effusa]|uniref:Uncharacterized protein n=1 Tax=Venturia effusa TaxID=50376 RepID=A0A517LA63_9PEZI|nr:hypothetical protein FKW77_000175 [Venturia effusa]
MSKMTWSSKLHAKLDAAEKSNSTLLQELQGRNDEIRSLQQEIERCKTETDTEAAERDKSNLRRLVSSLQQQENRDSEAKRINLEKDLADLKKENHSFENLFDALYDEIMTAKKAASAAEDLRTKLHHAEKEEEEELRKKIVQLEEDAETERNTAKSELDNSKSELTTVKARLLDTEKDLERKKNINHVLATENKELQDLKIPSSDVEKMPSNRKRGPSVVSLLSDDEEMPSNKKARRKKN